ncbi:MAG: uL15 family ribosomal protein, partial [archaeon]
IMVERKRRKKNKLRGQRTMGAGNTKSRRGAGGRGGRGKAGTNKHRFHSMGRLKPVKYRLKAERKGEAIQLGKLNAMLDEMVKSKKATKEGDKYIVGIPSGFEKILSQGEATHKIVLKINASKKAIEKIVKAGGKFEFAKKNFKSEDLAFSGDSEDEDLEFEEVEGETQ